MKNETFFGAFELWQRRMFDLDAILLCNDNKMSNRNQVFHIQFLDKMHNQ